MGATEPDAERRRFLIGATSVIGGIGLACAAFPFLSSWTPSVRAKALGAPVEVDISKMEPGQKLTVAWRGQPVFIVRRSLETLNQLEHFTSDLRDPLSHESQQPAYAANIPRSIKPDILVLIGICTHLGCVPLYKPEKGVVEAGWNGGFFCPCHGSKYDLAGRVYKGVPAPLNLPVPPYQYLKDSLLLIGSDAPVGTAT
jgi:ubiquinol-cytochrome c reductase iron-sulfur subunit